MVVFALAALVIAFAGTKLCDLADRLADRTGLGEALVGGVFLGVSTSLSGITASVTAAVEGLPALAVSNAMGGIAVQAAFLAVADVFHPRANLEHASASVSNLMQASVLVALMAGTVLLISGPGWTAAGIDLGTPLLVLGYALGLRAVYRISQAPPWRATRTAATVEDVPAPGASGESLSRLGAGFALAAVLVVAAGTAIAHSAGAVVVATGLSESLVGGVFTAISTSLPELVTTIAAVRRGAVTLAVGDIVGGNAFDVLFVCVADAFYRPGSIYKAVGEPELFLAALATLLNVVILMGLIRRERKGLANIGFESVLVLVLYGTGILVLARMG